jgi:hypothetical protein
MPRQQSTALPAAGIWSLLPDWFETPQPEVSVGAQKDGSAHWIRERDRAPTLIMIKVEP